MSGALIEAISDQGPPRLVPAVSDRSKRPMARIGLFFFRGPEDTSGSWRHATPTHMNWWMVDCRHGLPNKTSHNIDPNPVEHGSLQQNGWISMARGLATD